VNRSAVASALGRLYEYTRGVNGLQGVDWQVSVDMDLCPLKFLFSFVCSALVERYRSFSTGFPPRWAAREVSFSPKQRRWFEG
jgi:hypothetical protein